MSGWELLKLVVRIGVATYCVTLGLWPALGWFVLGVVMSGGSGRTR